MGLQIKFIRKIQFLILLPLLILTIKLLVHIRYSSFVLKADVIWNNDFITLKRKLGYHKASLITDLKAYLRNQVIYLVVATKEERIL